MQFLFVRGGFSSVGVGGGGGGEGCLLKWNYEPAERQNERAMKKNSEINYYVILHFSFTVQH